MGSTIKFFDDPHYPYDKISYFEFVGDYIVAAEYALVKRFVIDPPDAVYYNITYQWLGYIAHRDNRNIELTTPVHQGKQMRCARFRLVHELASAPYHEGGVMLVFDGPGQINISTTGIVGKITAVNPTNSRYVCCTQEFVFRTLRNTVRYLQEFPTISDSKIKSSSPPHADEHQKMEDLD